MRAWRGDDVEKARTVYGKLSKPARPLFDMFIDAPGKRFSVEEVAEKLGTTNPYQVAGTFSWPRRHSSAVGREIPVDWDEEAREYWMEEETARAFRAARDG